MPSKRSRTTRRKSPRPVTGNLDPIPTGHYVRGASGLSRPARDDTYVLNGALHRFDGKCHDDCPNVR